MSEVKGIQSVDFSGSDGATEGGFTHLAVREDGGVDAGQHGVDERVRFDGLISIVLGGGGKGGVSSK